MDVFLYIISEIVLGFGLQSVSCIIWLFTFYPGEISKKHFILFSALLTIEMLIVRAMPITFGLHTILSIITIIFIAIWVLKINVYRSVVIGSLTAVVILVCEFIVYISFMLFLGDGITQQYVSSKTFLNKIPGIIANVLFFLFVTITYIISKSKSKAKLFTRTIDNGKYVS